MFTFNNSSIPIDHTYWYLTNETCPPLTGSQHVDIVIIGGGMAGISAAHAAATRGLKVALLEKAFIGSGASGKSSGFITPDAEFSFSDLVALHGPIDACRIWKFIESGVERIRTLITTHNIMCEFQEKETLVLATSAAATKKLYYEHETRINNGLSSQLYTQDNIKTVIQSNKYYAAVSYGNTFSIKVFDYCQALKKIIRGMGVLVYENSPAHALEGHRVITAHGRIDAQYIIVATDYQVPKLSPLVNDTYPVQTFLMSSAPLAADTVKKIFPEHDCMAWDTDLIYQYFRFTPDNRLLMGGSDLLATYSTMNGYHQKRIFKKLANYLHTYFPQISVEWEYIWPGLIGISKDLLPLAGKDPHKPVYYMSSAAGLPWAAALGTYAIESLIEKNDEFDIFFNPFRNFLIPHRLQKLIGTKLTFALCNFQKVSSL